MRLDCEEAFVDLPAAVRRDMHTVLVNLVNKKPMRWEDVKDIAVQMHRCADHRRKIFRENAMWLLASGLSEDQALDIMKVLYPELLDHQADSEYKKSRDLDRDEETRLFGT